MDDTNKDIHQPTDPSDRWFILALVSLNYFTLLLHRQVMGYVLPPLEAELGLSEQQQGWLLPAFIMPYGFSQFFMGYLSDRFQRRTILLYSLCASILVVAVMAFAGNFTQLLILRACLGLAQAASVPAIGGIVADCFSPKNRSTAVALYLMSYSVGLMAAGSVGGTIAENSWEFVLGGFTLSLTGWRMSMISFSLFGVIILALLSVCLREPDRTERNEEQGVRTVSAGLWKTIYSVLSVPSFWILTTIFVLFSIVTGARDFWLAKYFYLNFDMTEGQAGSFATFYIQPSTFVGQLFGGLLADRWSRHWRGGRSAICTIAFVVWVPSLLIMGMSQSTNLVAAAMICFGLALGIYIANLWATTFEIIDPATRSTSLGLLNVFSSFPSLIAPTLGALVDKGIIENYGTAFAGLSLVAVTIVILFIIHLLVTLPRDFLAPKTDT